VRRKIKNKILNTSCYLVVLVLVIFIFVGNIWSRIYLISIGYEIGRKESCKKRLTKQTDKLRWEISTLCFNYKIENKLEEKGYEYPKRWETLKVLAMKK
jgi:hypothetical protein